MGQSKKIEVKCLRLNELGEGIALNGKNEVCIPNLLPSERAIVEIPFNNYQKPRVLKYLKTSPSRCIENCKIYNRCGSCHLLHLKYEDQIKFKENYVINCFKKENIPFNVHNVIKATKKTQYRNKMQVAYKMKDGKVICGFYEEGSHNIIPLDNCLVQTNHQLEVVLEIKNLMNKMRISAYDEDRRSGVIRFALLREGFTTNQLLVTIVTNSEIFPGRNDFVKNLVKKCPYITTIIQNVNSRKTSIILGENEKVLYGKGYIEDFLCGIKFKLSSKSFFQINPEQTQNLYNKVKEMANFKGNETIIDAYCGVGTIGIILSSQVKQVIGVESNKQAVSYAINNVKDNKINNVRFINQDATEFINSYEKEGLAIDAIIMDPPRTGSTISFLESVLKLSPKKVIYVSCEASTLARDMKILLKKYQMIDNCLVDLFVGTYHIETIISLELKNK